jgi:2'-5' RNA ligase
VTQRVVVCAAFDEDGDAEIAALMNRLRENGVSVPQSPAHRPHITLSAAIADPDAVARVTVTLAAQHEPVDVTLDRIGTFGHGSTLWVGPSARSLAYLQSTVHNALGAWPRAFGDAVEPEHWVPHCTLARRVPRSAPARLRLGFTAPTVRVVALATIVVGGRGDHALAPLHVR